MFLDANVIIEAFRTGTWNELAAGFHFETVEEVVRESLTGDSSKGHVLVDATALRDGLQATHLVTRKERNKLLADHPAQASLDPGELDLFAHLYSAGSLPPSLVVSTADKGAIVGAGRLKWLDKLISLEELLQSARVARPKLEALQSHYRADFLAAVRTKVWLGVIP